MYIQTTLRPVSEQRLMQMAVAVKANAKHMLKIIKRASKAPLNNQTRYRTGR